MENKFFEDAFKAYERGINIFPHPHVMEIWLMYLDKFLTRYPESRLERARELFEQALETCPAGANKVLFLMYAKLEKERGLARHALRIYDEAVKKVAKEDQDEMYKIYIQSTADMFGVIRTREVYEKAIQNLPDALLPDFCLRFKNLEEQLGEIDRCRSVLMYGCQFADPMTNKNFWEEWNKFELNHGTEETFREMLRMKRSVAATSTSSTMLGFVSAGIIGGI
eukprot:UN26468